MRTYMCQVNYTHAYITTGTHAHMKHTRTHDTEPHTYVTTHAGTHIHNHTRTHTHTHVHTHTRIHKPHTRTHTRTLSHKRTHCAMSKTTAGSGLPGTVRCRDTTMFNVNAHDPKWTNGIPHHSLVAPPEGRTICLVGFLQLRCPSLFIEKGVRLVAHRASRRKIFP